METICFADDTLIVAEGNSLEQAIVRTNARVKLIFNKVKKLGLKIALGKTEAVAFYSRG